MPTPSYALYFQELAEKDPIAVCKRTLCEYDESVNTYKLSIWGQDYAVFPEESRISRDGTHTLDPENYIYLFIIQYLLHAKDIDIQNQWISEKDIPGGPTFFRGPHEIPTNLIASRFGNDLEGFKHACELLNGVPVDMGDAAYRFQIAPRIPVAVLYWVGDEDFSPGAKILFDKTITDHLASDTIFALAVAVCRRFGRA
jgi:hypothetical protein